MDLSKDDLRQIQVGGHPEWTRIGDPSAYGGVFKSQKYPGKVIKVQSGDYKLYDNEIARQFQAQIENQGDYEVAQIHSSNFYPNNPSVQKKPDSNGIYKYEPEQTGISYIFMDEADFDEVQGGINTRKSGKARGLISLYNDAGVSHTDDHPGNIKWNNKTGKPVLLDFGLATEADGNTGRGKRIERIQQLLSSSGNQDMLDLWNETHGDLYSDHIQGPTPKTKADLDNWVKQGEEVGLMTHPNIADVNWTRENQKAVDADTPIEVTRSGAKAWGYKQNNGGPTVSSPKIPGTSWFEAQLRALDRLKPTWSESMGKAFKATPLTGALSVGAADLIPSKETVQTAYKKGIVEAVDQHGQEFLRSLPVAGGVAALSIPAPAIATAAAYAGPGLVAVAGAEAVNEVVKQQTGEGIIPKFQQAIGTKERTGRVEGSAQEKLEAALDRIQNPPTITPTTRKPRRSQIKDAPIPDFAHRLRLAGDRFNPSKGEFGLSELIFGR